MFIERGNFKSRFPKTVDVLDKAVQDGVFPTYSVGVHANGTDEFHSFGCSSETLFDLASVSKVLCTTTLAAIADERTKLSIEAPVKAFFPKFPDERVKISHLLDHSSGLPAWLDLHSLFHEPKGPGQFDPRATPAAARVRYEEEILKSHIRENFEKQVTYSDLGFMLLGWALEKQLNSPLDALFQEWIVGPARLDSLQFLPISPDVVPTEDCPWRGHILRGEVHDDNCYVLGGVAGHAGVFGNTLDVLEAGKIWLSAYNGQKTNLISPKTAHLFWDHRTNPASSRALGWDGVSFDLNGNPQSSSGHYMSKSARGHLGYTGTSLWIDPQKDLVVTLLTNRVHPTRTNEKIKAFRPRFHDALLQELGFNK